MKSEVPAMGKASQLGPVMLMLMLMSTIPFLHSHEAEKLRSISCSGLVHKLRQ